MILIKYFLQQENSHEQIKNIFLVICNSDLICCLWAGNRRK